MQINFMSENAYRQKTLKGFIIMFRSYLHQEHFLFNIFMKTNCNKDSSVASHQLVHRSTIASGG